MMLPYHAAIFSLTIISCSANLKIPEGATLPCNSTKQCPGKTVCSDNVCVDPGTFIIVANCIGQPDGTGCAWNQGNGVCVSETCTESVCGDGLVGPGESCDGTLGESADCDADCTPSTCGDNLINMTAGEICEDGNNVTETECLYGQQTCTLCNSTCSVEITLAGSYCGDGILDEPYEACEGGPGCSVDCGCTSGDGCDDGSLESGWTCHRDLPGCSLVRTAEACLGLPNFTRCDLDTFDAEGFDRSYDICVDDVCVSPGCGDPSCNAPGANFDVAGASYDYTVSEPVQNEPVVLDNSTGLYWQGCPAGLSGSQCAVGTQFIDEWRTAVQYCDDLSWGGYEDWGLPSRLELVSIVNYDTQPVIDLTAFPGTPTDPGSTPKYWTTSAYDYGGLIINMWVVYFYNGWVSNTQPYNQRRVRCVRHLWES